ncbi:hypothetical protein [Vibrio cyclitrophicus]|uniref:hypothetical protein n=1 Tax=Vibrio cyclitrophicus TaxID=47951 RepID=UPI001F535B4F|nr:hypothetical protein [Vibrio cyclitrophicus]
MLKNWTVITQATLDVMAREHYLLNKRHRNHKQTEKIINIYGSAKQSLNILRNCERYKLKQAAQRRGGRPPRQSVEFVFTLPKKIRPTPQQWRKIFNKLMVNLASHLNIPTSQLAPIVRAVLHQQDQNPVSKGSGDHIHVVAGKFTNNLTYLKELQRKSTTRLLKVAFNDAVLDIVGIDHRSYVPSKSYDGVAKNRVPSWKVKAVRKQENVQSLEQQLKRMINQANKWLAAFELGDSKQMNRQYNRLHQELLTLESSHDQNQSLIELSAALLSNIDKKSQRKERLKKLFASSQANF